MQIPCSKRSTTFFQSGREGAIVMFLKKGRNQLKPSDVSEGGCVALIAICPDNIGSTRAASRICSPATSLFGPHRHLLGPISRWPWMVAQHLTCALLLTCQGCYYRIETGCGVGQSAHWFSTPPTVGWIGQGCMETNKTDKCQGES